MKSEYQKLLNKVENLKCLTCNGLGICDDADCGDIMFNKWICKECNGSGIKEPRNSNKLKNVDYEDRMGGQFTQEELNRPDRL